MNQELLDRLADMPRRVRELADGFTGDIRRQPKPGWFSLLENACHLRDIELLAYESRIQRMLHEESPELPDVDGGLIAREVDYNANEQLAPALDAFAAVRALNVATLRGLSEEESARTGLLEGAGTITLAQLAERMDEHDRGHLEEIAALTR